MKKIVTMRDALTDPNLLGNVLAGPTWENWRTYLIAALGEKLDRRERNIFRKFTGGRKTEPGKLVDILLCLIGRRGGKSRAGAALAIYFSCLCDYSAIAARGERLKVLFLSKNQRQSAVVFNYCVGILESVPMLSRMIVNKTSDCISLSNGIDLEIRAADAGGIRGVTCAAVIGDEICHWTTDGDSHHADSLILAAVRPCLATTNGPLILISSVYAKRGEAYNIWEKHFGPDGDPRTLVVVGTSRDFNESLKQSVIDREMERDPANASAEYLSIWRSDLDQYVTADVVKACTVKGRFELPPDAGERYSAFVDLSSGLGRDSATLCIGHRHVDGDRSKIIIDVLREARPPFEPASVVDEWAQLLARFSISRVWSDRYSLGWTNEAFARHSIGLDFSPLSRLPVP